jgi:hypothetical protein
LKSFINKIKRFCNIFSVSYTENIYNIYQSSDTIGQALRKKFNLKSAGVRFGASQVREITPRKAPKQEKEADRISFIKNTRTMHHYMRSFPELSKSQITDLMDQLEQDQEK